MNDSFEPTGRSNTAEPALKKGLDALKRKDYVAAVAQLEVVSQNTTHRPTQVQAQMGLVKAYEQIGEVKGAIDLCHLLNKSKSRQVQQWADQSLAKLTQRYPDAAAPIASDLTGFVPLTHAPQPSQRERVETEETAATPASDRELEFENPFYLSEEVLSEEALSEEALSEEAISDEPIAPSKTDEAIGIPQTPTRTPPQAAKAALSQPIEWRQAGRAQKWAGLGASQLESLWALELGTTIALFGLVVVSVGWVADQTVGWLSLIESPVDLREVAVYYQRPFWSVVLFLVALFGLSPWLLDWVLRSFHRLQPLSIATLSSHSREAERVLKRVSSQRRSPLPKLGILPTAAPLAISYGYSPQTARIAVSQGLLKQLTDDEIAAVYAGELGHIARWDFAVMSFVTLVLQIPYLVYWQAAVGGDWVAARRSMNRPLRLFLLSIAGVISALGYGLYWLYRWAGLLLSRIRLYYSDRFASETTGNPNGLTRALLKMTIGTATEIQQRGYTSYLLESVELLTPIGHRAALSFGSVLPHSSIAEATAWERASPARRWLTLNNTHPLLSDRLDRLDRYAQHWRLEPELDLPRPPQSHRSLWLQAAPWLGMLAGLAIALALWTVGAIADWMNWIIFSWLRGDRGTLWGLVLMGFSFGTFLRINAFFPDIRSTNTQVEPLLPAMLSDAAPLSSQPVQFRGKLLGRKGVGNWLVQDLLLQTGAGCIKLHYLSQLGAPGNLLLHPHRPDDWVNRSVTVIGWFRRGATPWIDVDRIHIQQGTTIRSNHPIWSTLLASVAALWGAWLIVQGGLR